MKIWAQAGLEWDELILHRDSREYSPGPRLLRRHVAGQIADVLTLLRQNDAPLLRVVQPSAQLGSDDVVHLFPQIVRQSLLGLGRIINNNEVRPAAKIRARDTC